MAYWYFIVYVLGIFFFLYQLLRRGSRKRKQEKIRHREVLDAIEQQKRL